MKDSRWFPRLAKRAELKRKPSIMNRGQCAHCRAQVRGLAIWCDKCLQRRLKLVGDE